MSLSINDKSILSRRGEGVHINDCLWPTSRLVLSGNGVSLSPSSNPEVEDGRRCPVVGWTTLFGSLNGALSL